MAGPMGFMTKRETATPSNELLPLKIADLEVALDMCNNISAFISKRVAELQKLPGNNDAEIERLYELRRYYLRSVKAKMSLANMDYVREFMDTHGPDIARAFATGELPAFLHEAQLLHAE